MQGDGSPIHACKSCKPLHNRALPCTINLYAGLLDRLAVILLPTTLRREAKP